MVALIGNSGSFFPRFNSEGKLPPKESSKFLKLFSTAVGVVTGVGFGVCYPGSLFEKAAVGTVSAATVTAYLFGGIKNN